MIWTFIALLTVYLVIVTIAVIIEPKWLPLNVFSSFAFVGAIALACYGQYLYNHHYLW